MASADGYAFPGVVVPSGVPSTEEELSGIPDSLLRAMAAALDSKAEVMEVGGVAVSRWPGLWRWLAAVPDGIDIDIDKIQAALLPVALLSLPRIASRERGKGEGGRSGCVAVLLGLQDAPVRRSEVLFCACVGVLLLRHVVC